MTSKPAMIQAIRDISGISNATGVFNYYLDEGIIKSGAHSGFNVVHGKFLDRDVLLRASSYVGTDSLSTE